MQQKPNRSLFRVALRFFVLLTLTIVAGSYAADYFTYYDSAGKLVISNKQPPPGSKIVKKQDFPEPTAEESQKIQESKEPPAANQRKENEK